MSATLFTSDIKKTRLVYIIAVLFCVAFGTVYEIFSHRVYSSFMIFAWTIPLAGGIINEVFMRLNREKIGTGISIFLSPALQLLAGAVLWLTLGSIYKGVLDIYGTTNRLITVFPIAGGVLAVSALTLGTAATVDGRRN